MKHWLLVPVFVFAGFLGFAQNDVEAPVNPEFLKWQIINQTGEASGEIPFYVLPHFQTRHNTTNYRFDPVYDMRQTAFLTDVKNQGSCGACWTFASIGSIESYLLKNGYGTFDLSEQNVRTCHGFTLNADLTCRGGNAKKAAAYCLRMSGPVEEVADPYNDDMYEVCNEGITPILRLDQFRVFPDDQSVVKQAILDYGALYTSMYWDVANYNSGDYTYYYNGVESSSHAILIVGWVDTKVTAGGTGAWIIKNSWGTSWGESGYFYLSYEDAVVLLTSSAFPGFSEIVAGDTLFMYDELGWISSTGYSSETAYALIKFVTGEAKKITDIGTYINTEGATVNIEVYDTKSGNTLSGLLASAGPFTCDYPGYHKFAVTPFNLGSSDDFYIKMTYNTPGYNYPIPFEKFSTDYSDPFIESGVCWMSSSGTSWTAVGSDVTGKERDWTIRAYGEAISTTDEAFLAEKASVSANFDNNGMLNLRISGFESLVQVELLDIAGRVVFSEQLTTSSENVELSVPELPSGVYSLNVSDSKVKQTTKLFR
ncbi:MAG: T9SS type A sorting domain-containing protein [Bacteroidetes bacterium]|nr:T9SS type A sorting domain-containing protein [Bacteroidota bacterium]MBU1718290.1 T9SS type A sorting domain-containing protein [Bacteroidota bacterium]